MKLELKLSGSFGLCLYTTKRITVIAIEAVSSGKPHEAPAILQNGSNIALRQAIVGGEVGEFEVPHRSMAALGMDILKVAGGGVRSLFSGPRGSRPFVVRRAKRVFLGWAIAIFAGRGSAATARAGLNANPQPATKTANMMAIRRTIGSSWRIPALPFRGVVVHTIAIAASGSGARPTGSFVVVLRNGKAEDCAGAVLGLSPQPAAVRLSDRLQRRRRAKRSAVRCKPRVRPPRGFRTMRPLT